MQYVKKSAAVQLLRSGEGANWSDIQIHTIDVRPNGTMTDVIQCSECMDIFDGMRVTSQ